MSEGTIFLNSYLSNDSTSKFWLYFTNTFGNSGATLINDASDNPITGIISGHTTINFTFDYTGNTQGGRTPGTDVNYTAVAIGYGIAQYVVVTGVINSGNTNNIYLYTEVDWSKTTIPLTLQTTYDNSNNPEIITNNTLGSLTVRRGSLSDIDKIFEIQNGGGLTTFSINGSGDTIANTMTLTGISTTTNFDNYVVIDDNGTLLKQYGATYNDIYYDSGLTTLFVPNINLTGAKITLANIQNIADNETKLVLSGGTIYQVTGSTTTINIKSGNITLTSTDDMILVSGSTTTNITMPSIANANPNGYSIKNIGYGTINFNIYGTEYIDGYSNFGILNHNTAIRLIPYVNQWYVF